MTDQQRRARDAALGRLLECLDQKVYAQVTDAVDFARLDVIEQALVVELERLIADGQMPAAPDRRAIETRAASMVGAALLTVSGDPRRTKHPREDHCELCRTLGAGAYLS